MPPHRTPPSPPPEKQCSESMLAGEIENLKLGEYALALRTPQITPLASPTISSCFPPSKAGLCEVCGPSPGSPWTSSCVLPGPSSPPCLP